MATEAQIAANRRNSQKSTGPRTPEGKAASCLNALQTGIDAQSEIIPGEDPATLETLAAALHDQYEPATPIEAELVDSIVHHTWLLRRHRRIEAQVWEGERRRLAAITFSDVTHGEAFANHAPAFSRLQRRIDAAERNLHRSIHEIRRQQAERLASLQYGAPQWIAPAPDSAPSPAPTPAPDSTLAELPELASFHPPTPTARNAPPAQAPRPASPFALRSGAAALIPPASQRPTFERA